MAPLLQALLAFMRTSHHLSPLNTTTASPQAQLPIIPGPFHTRLDNLLQRRERVATPTTSTVSPRDFVWTETKDERQDLCGDSTFGTASSPGGGAPVSDCQTLVDYANKPENWGYWTVTGPWGGDGLTWNEFDVLHDCKIAVRHVDGDTSNNDIPIGNQDVIDIINQAIASYSDGEVLPVVNGNMTCTHTATTSIEWQIYS